MKHFLPTLGLLLVLLAGTASAALLDFSATARPSLVARRAPLEDTVYVCLGAHAQTYHFNKTCQWLTRCGHPVQVLEAAEAEERGKRACRHCLLLKV